MSENRIHITAELAGIPFELICRNKKHRNFFKDYLTQKDPRFTFEITEEDLDKEKEYLERIPDTVYRDYEFSLENSAIHRKVMNELVKHNIVLLHGSALSMDGEAVIFSAKSGTGKSTHTRLWREVYGDRVVMIDDDKPLLKTEGDKIIVYGTPWNGKHHLGSNTSAPLKAIVKLTRGETNSIVGMNKADAFQLLLRQVYMPEDKDLVKSVLKTENEILNCIPFFLLKCNMEKEAAEISYQGIFEEIRR